MENFAANSTAPPVEGDGWPITLEELELALAAADPAVRLLLPRVLRRVIRQDAGLTGFAFRVPHRRSYVISRQRLLEIVDLDELGRGGDLLPETVLLIERPSHEELAVTPAAEMLRRWWRLVFHSRIHATLQQSIAEGQLSPADVCRRIEQLGAIEFDEIRNVLRQEHYLLQPDDERAVYVEFAAVYLELKWFAPALVPSYFPALGDPAAMERVLAQDIDAEAVLRATRPTAPRHAKTAEEAAVEAEQFLRSDPPQGPEPPAAAALEKIYRQISPRKFSHYVRLAERAATAGNLVRSAICRARAELCAPRTSASIMHARMRSDVSRLVARLQAVLGFAAEDVEPWRKLLLALVRQTPRGYWTVEARLLYDLQKACLDQERPLYTVDPMEWLFSRGARPVKRPLPNQRDVLISKHVRSAARRLRTVRVSEAQRQELGRLLRAATQGAEGRLRERFRPLLATTLSEVGLQPQNLPERVAKKKIVEELLDFIIERGFLTMGELRDAISRNNLKQPDCGGPRDFRRGNALLRANQRLGVTLDGVYQRAEIYLRWIQYFSLLAFGTKTGRFLTRYLAVPFGGAYLILAGLDHLVGLLTHHEPGLKSETTVLALGLFLEGLLHVPWLRQALWRGLKGVFRVARFVLVDSLCWLVRAPLVQWVLHSRVVVIGFRYLLKPLALTLLLLLALPPELTAWHHAAAAAAIFFGMNLAINSRLGRNLEEMAADGFMEGWHRFGLRFISGLFWLVIDMFRRLLQIIERFLYAVDQWVRFTSGQSRLVLLAKACLGVLWFFVSYVIRFCVNLLIEPQINPIKHFPVVTVSHKLLAPFWKAVYEYLHVNLHMDAARASLFTTSILFSIPGIFGFLVWELRENWRLFAANRPTGLLPVPIGPHGESMIRLLKPGLHSGTVPKQFAKLRRAHRKALADGGDAKTVRKHAESLERLALRIRRYLEREFVELLADSPAWSGPPPAVAEIRLATNRVRARIVFPGREKAALDLDYSAYEGWIVAGSVVSGSREQYSPDAWHALVTGVIGLFKTGGAELVRQHVEALLPPPPARYDIRPQGIVVWPEGDPAIEVLYDLTNGPLVAPRLIRGYPRRDLPMLPRSRLVFREMPITWTQWVESWER